MSHHGHSSNDRKGRAAEPMRRKDREAWRDPASPSHRRPDLGPGARLLPHSSGHPAARPVCSTTVVHQHSWKHSRVCARVCACVHARARETAASTMVNTRTDAEEQGHDRGAGRGADEPLAGRTQPSAASRDGPTSGGAPKGPGRQGETAVRRPEVEAMRGWSLESISRPPKRQSQTSSWGCTAASEDRRPR